MRGAPWAWLLAWSALVGGCPSAEPPPECEAFLACVYPESGKSPVPEDRFRNCAEDPFLEHREDGDAGPAIYVNKDATLEAMGPGGSCWSGGPGDAYYELCRLSCERFLQDDCVRPPVDGGPACAAASRSAGLDQCLAVGVPEGSDPDEFELTCTP